MDFFTSFDQILGEDPILKDDGVPSSVLHSKASATMDVVKKPEATVQADILDTEVAAPKEEETSTAGQEDEFRTLGGIGIYSDMGPVETEMARVFAAIDEGLPFEWADNDMFWDLPVPVEAREEDVDMLMSGLEEQTPMIQDSVFDRVSDVQSISEDESEDGSEDGYDGDISECEWEGDFCE
jgi:hypothetical protein